MINQIYAIRNGAIVSIMDVPSGLKCECICPSCKSKLIAKTKGVRRRAHFAHWETKDCTEWFESLIHIFSKETILNNNNIHLPPVYLNYGFSYANSESAPIYNSYKFEYVDPIFEINLGSIKPDCIIKSKSGKKLAIEFAVTHFCDISKILEYKKMGLPAIEVDLSKIKGDINKADLVKLILTKSDNKKWLFNQKQNNINHQISSLATKYPVVIHGCASHIMNCPISIRKWRNIPYANLIDDCFYCKYYYYHECNEESSHSAIYCLGNHKNEFDKFQQLTSRSS